jgi:Protein of unknown function (DUF4199)
MKKTIVTFGLISGVLSSLMMFATVPFHDRIGFNNGLILGYTTIVLSFMLVFFGIRSYRDNVAGGSITFARAFGLGILITLVSCALYVGTWEVIYFKLMPDFAEKLSKSAIETVIHSGGTKEMIDAKVQEMKDLTALLNNPLKNAGMAFLEPFPVGLIVTLISAAILRKKPAPAGQEEEVGAPVMSS